MFPSQERFFFPFSSFYSQTLTPTSTYKPYAFGRLKIALFSSTLPTQEEIESLPAFPQEKATLRLLLGAGPLEKCEGTAIDIFGAGSGEAEVAVKVMRLF